MIDVTVALLVSSSNLDRFRVFSLRTISGGFDVVHRLKQFLLYRSNLVDIVEKAGRNAKGISDLTMRRPTSCTTNEGA